MVFFSAGSTTLSELEKMSLMTAFNEKCATLRSLTSEHSFIVRGYAHEEKSPEANMALAVGAAAATAVIVILRRAKMQF